MSVAGKVDIPALTGVRFFAAMAVVVAHAAGSITALDKSAPFTSYVMGLSAVGMSLFFVLSGFVIHYNYRETITYGGVAGFWKFGVARFARLYPLYFLLIVLQLSYDGSFRRALEGHPEPLAKMLEAGPYYLTLTQTWFFKVVGNNNLVYQFGNVAISWSISTEWFFYLCYPLMAFAVLRLLPGIYVKLLAIGVISVVAILAMRWVIFNAAWLNEYALVHFGRPATMLSSGQDSLYRWLIYFSPYSRVMEFIIGVLACAIYLDVADRPAGKLEERLGLAAAILAIAAIAVTHALMFMPSRPFPILTQYHMAHGFTLPVALLLFCLMRYRNIVTTILSWRPFVLGGEVSYSLYLLHLLVIGWCARQGLTTLAPNAVLGWGMVVVIAGAALAVSFVSYRLIEVPARRWFRRVLSEQPRPPDLEAETAAPRQPVLGALTTISRGAALVCFVVAPLFVTVFRPPPRSAPPPEGRIDVVNATYGKSCGAPVGNVTERVVNACSGLVKCQYKLDARKLAGPEAGCKKDFTVRWRCSKEGAINEVIVSGEWGLPALVAALSCEEPLRKTQTKKVPPAKPAAAKR